MASVLKQKLPTLWSEASFNNDIGVPLTLLSLSRSHRVAVLEVGTNHPGELAPLLQTVQPRYGIITNIGREHLEFFGDLAGVAQEQGALAEALPAEEREVVGLIFYHGWEQAKVAELFQVNERTVRRRWQSAMLKLHHLLQAEPPS